jgi:quinoprotein relay system zinc metallohydrolase 2
VKGCAPLACTMLCALIAAQARSAAPESAPGKAWQIEQVAPGVYAHFGRPLPLDAAGHDDIANIGFIVGSRCVAVIDTGGSERVGKALRAAIGQATHRPVCYIINTHMHFDHVLGDSAFDADHASLVGHAALPAEIARNRSYFQTQYGGDARAPDRTVSDRLQLDLGDRTLQLRAWPTAHTDCDLTVLDERTATLWTGDLLFRQRLPALDGDAAGWLRVLEELARMPVQRAVPGHGPLARDLAAALQPEQRYLRALTDDVRRELDGGESLQHAIDHAASGEQSQWLLWDSTHPRNVTRLYEQLEWQ